MERPTISEKDYRGLRAFLRRRRPNWNEDWVEDCLQDGLLKALRYWNGKDRFFTWACHCIWWASADRLRDCYGRTDRRKIKREVQASDLVFESTIDPSLGPVGEAERRDEVQRAIRITDSLSPRMRHVVKLKALGLTHQEVAEQLGVAAGTVAQHLHLMRKQLWPGV